MRQYAEEEGIRIHDAPPKTFSPFEHWRLPGDLRQSFDIGVVVSFGYFLVRINDTLKHCGYSKFSSEWMTVEAYNKYDAWVPVLSKRSILRAEAFLVLLCTVLRYICIKES